MRFNQLLNLWIVHQLVQFFLVLLLERLEKLASRLVGCIKWEHAFEACLELGHCGNHVCQSINHCLREFDLLDLLLVHSNHSDDCVKRLGLILLLGEITAFVEQSAHFSSSKSYGLRHCCGVDRLQLELVKFSV